MKPETKERLDKLEDALLKVAQKIGIVDARIDKARESKNALVKRKERLEREKQQLIDAETMSIIKTHKITPEELLTLNRIREKEAQAILSQNDGENNVHNPEESIRRYETDHEKINIGA